MENNIKINIFMGVLYSLVTVMLVLIGFVYTVSFVGAGISAFIAYTAFRGDKVTIKFAKLKKGFKIRKDAKNGKRI